MYAARVSRAILAGASGLVGSHCLRAALQHYERVVALVRRKLPLEHPRLEQRIVDFEKIGELDLRADDVFAALGAMMNKVPSWEAFRHVDFDYSKALAERAAEGGARQFLLVTTVDANMSARWRRYTAMKRELEAAVAALPFTAVHFFRPGLLLGKREARRPIEEFMALLMKPGKIFCRGSWSKFHPSTGAMVGRAMVAAALRAEPGVHIYHYDEMCALSSALSNAIPGP